MHTIPFIDSPSLRSLLPYDKLIPALQIAFQNEYIVPQRHHHDYANPKEGIDSTLLLMPAWQVGRYLGVKMVTVSPNNGDYNLPSIHGIYTLFDAHQGQPLAFMEAKTLTSLRTAAASALASSYLSRLDSSKLLMVGTGAMAPELIRAHASVRPIEEVLVWGRNFSKANQICKQLGQETFAIKAVKNLSAAIAEVDIISVATLSSQSLIHGAWLQAGQHLDLVGSFKPNMREADDEVIKKSVIFVDVLEGATKESGDLVIPLSKGIISSSDIKGDLFDLCSDKRLGRTNTQEITCFKSVGYALEDLAAAILAYENRHLSID